MGLKVLDFHCIIPSPPRPSRPAQDGGVPGILRAAIGPFLRLNPGDIVELTKAEAEQNWWEV